MDKQIQPFSKQLERWLKGKGPKTLDDLTGVFGEKSFAITILLLMFLPALPLPTGGVTHVFEIITMLLSLEMMIGRRTIWLPSRWRAKQLGGQSQKKLVPFMACRIRWFEKYSKPRFSGVLKSQYFLSVCGLILFGFSLAALLAPPFSFLDTLPALGAVAVALSIILEDIGVFVAGCMIGIFGIIVEIFFGSIIVAAVRHLL